jgi:hypothetical protein
MRRGFTDLVGVCHLVDAAIAGCAVGVDASPAFADAILCVLLAPASDARGNQARARAGNLSHSVVPDVESEVDRGASRSSAASAPPRTATRSSRATLRPGNTTRPTRPGVFPWRATA